MGCADTWDHVGSGLPGSGLRAPGSGSDARGAHRSSRAEIFVHESVYTLHVKCRDLERRLADLGWRFLRHGKRHDVWTDGEHEEAIPRHREINESLARAILRRASGGT